MEILTLLYCLQKYQGCHEGLDHGPITLATEFHQGQAYARSDWLLSGHYMYFLVMTRHYEIFSRLDGSFEL